MAKDDPENNPPDDSPQGGQSAPVKVSKADETALIESFSKPLSELEDALEQQRQDEREVFKQLIQENAQLKRAKEKAEAQVEEANTKYELLKIDLEAEQAKSKAKDETVKSMENDMRTLITTKKSKGKGKKSKTDDPDATANEESTITAKYDNSQALPFSDKYTQQIKDLKFRLRRLADDEAAKDTRITALEAELADTRELLVQLQGHVDESKVEQLKEEIAARRREKPVNHYDKENVVMSNDKRPAAQSAVCVIQ